MGADLLIYWLNRDAILRSLHVFIAENLRVMSSIELQQKLPIFLIIYIGRNDETMQTDRCLWVKVENLNPENDSLLFYQLDLTSFIDESSMQMYSSEYSS